MVENFIKNNIKLLKIKNNWDSASVWTGAFGNNSDEWEKYRQIS